MKYIVSIFSLAFAASVPVATSSSSPSTSGTRLGEFIQPFAKFSPGAANFFGDLFSAVPKAIAKAAVDDIANEINNDSSLNKNKLKLFAALALKSLPVDPEDSQDVQNEVDQIVQVLDDINAGKSKINFSPFEKKP